MKEEGVLDIPLDLMIVAIILLITIPVVLGVFSYYTNSSAEQQLSSEIKYLKNQIRIVYSQGNNASMVVRVSFPFGVQYIKIGGQLGSVDSHLIRYKMQNGVERNTIVSYGNIAIYMSDQGKTLTIVGGTYDLILTKEKANMDLNGDGVPNDYFVNVEVRQ